MHMYYVDPDVDIAVCIYYAQLYAIHDTRRDTRCAYACMRRAFQSTRCVMSRYMALRRQCNITIASTMYHYVWYKFRVHYFVSC